MERIVFTKMEGAGNDYVYVDAFADPRGPRAADDPRWPARAKALADRHFGVGADGLIVLARSETAACRMAMWNADGSRGAMCGNGLRCLAKLAFDLRHVREPSFVIETDAGDRRVELIVASDGSIQRGRAEMGRVTIDKVPRTLTHEGRSWNWLFGDAGNPHAVVFVDEDPERVPVLSLGARMQSEHAGGINVEVVRARADGAIEQRTFERGAGETLACGTGACAAAVAAIVTGRVKGPRVRVLLRGGELVVERASDSVVLEGPARTVFRGEIEI